MTNINYRLVDEIIMQEFRPDVPPENRVVRRLLAAGVDLPSFMDIQKKLGTKGKNVFIKKIVKRYRAVERKDNEYKKRIYRKN